MSPLAACCSRILRCTAHSSTGSAGIAGADLSVPGVGLGATYYFMPHNLYVSGSVGLAMLFSRLGRSNSRSDPGVAFDLSVGKEWWVSDQWGLGVAGGLGIHSLSADRSNDKWEGVSLGVRFSSTFN